ncbi:alpha/beta fold hydrolase [Nocardioides sp. SYSU DS0651]|uniref:alpha/beta fold hydrolase n=1 Tax=Nocardioides sp. SYSU DS0651 TaxID=3415955 RepID=UPI003F4C96FF
MTGPLIRAVGRRALGAAALAGRASGRAAVHGVRVGIRRTQRFPDLPDLPEGALVDLPGRGKVFAIDTGAPRPGAPTLLLFHGLATTSYLTWFSTIDELRRDYRLVMLDQRWHGRGILSDRFDIDECVDDAAALLDVLGIDEVVAVGYSMGGALAQVFWRRHPDRTGGLVLASTAGCWRGSLGDAVFYPVLGLANAALRSHYRTRVGLVHGALPEVPPRGTDLSAWAWAELRSTSAWALPEVLGALGSFDARPWLGEVDVPVAVVVTARDRAIPTVRQRALAAAIPGATVHEAPGGHASVVLDVQRWRPVFLAAVAEVARRAAT